MAFTKTQAIKAVEAHGFSFITQDGKIKFKSLHIDNDTSVDAYSYGLRHHDSFKPGEYTGLAHYSVYYIRTGEKNISIFFSYEDIRVYLCSITEEKLRQENERLTAEANERATAAEPTPAYTDPIINEEPLNFNDNLEMNLADIAGVYHTDQLPPHDIDSTYNPAGLPPLTPYELVTVAELAINDLVCFDHDRIIDQFHRIQSIVYCGAGNYSVVCDDTHYPYEVSRDTSVYRAIEPAPPNAQIMRQVRA